MRVGFIVKARSYLKVYGPIIEEAFRRGSEVYLLLHDSAEYRLGSKGYNWPDPKHVPAFTDGVPHVHQWQTQDALLAVCEREGIELVFSIWLPPRDYTLRQALRAQDVRWVSLQHGADHLVYPTATLLEPDVTCMFSQSLVDRAIEFHCGRARNNGNEAHVRSLLAHKLKATGFPELDVVSSLDRDEIRQRYGVPKNKPVVVWLPHDVHWQDLWEMLVFRRRWHPRLLLQAFFSRRLDLVRKLFNGVTHRQLLRAVREFCDRNGAFLIVKSRIKDCPPSYERDIADLFTFDRNDYPPTILEILSIADLCIHVFSVAALEAAYMQVPGLCLVPPPESWFMSDPDTGWRRTSADFLAPGTIWNFEGVSFMMELEEVVNRLPAMRLDDLALNPVSRNDYVRKFLGPTQGKASGNVLDVAESLMTLAGK